MLGVILRVVACLLFLIAAAGGTIFSQPPPDLVAFGLAAWVLSTLPGDPVVVKRLPARGE